MSLQDIMFGKGVYVIEDAVIRSRFVSLREARRFLMGDSVIVQPLYEYSGGDEMGAPPSVYFMVAKSNLGRPMLTREARRAGRDLSVTSRCTWFVVDIVAQSESGRT